MKQESILYGDVEDHPSNTTISKLFENLLKNNPDILDKTALIHSETKHEVSFKDLNESANRLARLLLTKIEQDELMPNSDGDYLVALRFQPDQSLVTTILALFKAGLAYVPIAPNWPEGRIEHILNEAEPIAVITNLDPNVLYKSQSKLPLNKKKEVFTFAQLSKDAIYENCSTENLPINKTLNIGQKGDKLFAVLYTSGSTGTPKGVRHLHRAALNRFHWQYKMYPYAEDEVCVFKTTLTFVDSVTEIWAPLLCGKQLVIFPCKVTQNVERFIERLEEFKIQRIFVVTSLVRNILAFVSMDKKNKHLMDVRGWECSAEVVTKDVLESFYNYFPPGHRISNFYGSTEMTDVTFATFYNIDDVNNALNNDQVPIGYPVDNTIAYVLDNELNPVSEGESGFLYISSRSLGDGYAAGRKGEFKPNPFKTNSSDFVYIYFTGDLAYCKNNRLYYQGRSDSQVKVRGHRVELLEIDRAVRNIAQVSSACVLCYKPGQPVQKIICYYTTKGDCFLPEPKLEILLANVLPDYMMPKLIKLYALPLLVNGKVDRQALFQKFEESLKCNTVEYSSKDFTDLPLSDHAKAKVLLESVVQVIQDPNCKPQLDDHFFSIGGDSINMVMVISKLKDHGYNISVTDFVSSSSIREMIPLLTTEEIEDNLDHEMEKMKAENNFTSSPLQEDHKEVVLDMVSRSFAIKGDLTTLSDVKYEDIKLQLEILWDKLLEANLSIVIYDKNKTIIGACLNFDARSPEAAPLCARAAFARTFSMSEEGNIIITTNDIENTKVIIYISLFIFLKSCFIS